jgi:hypothetical protein
MTPAEKEAQREEFMIGFEQAAKYAVLSKEQKEYLDAEYLARKAARKTKPVKERNVRDYFLKIAKSYDAEVRKCEWYRRRDAPDWFVALNGAHLVELKRPGEKPNPSQAREALKLEKKGVPVHVLSTYDEVDDFFERIAK